MEILMSLNFVFLFVQVSAGGLNDHIGKLWISPINPVRFRGQSLAIDVYTEDHFLLSHSEFDCMIQLGDEPRHLQHAATQNSAATFNDVFDNLVDSSVINATVSTKDTLKFYSNQTYLVVLPDWPKRIVLEEGKKSIINCLDPTENNKNLTFDWLKNNDFIDTPGMSVEAGKDDVTANYTCRIATKEAVEHYHSIEKAFNAGSAISVRRNISVVSIERKPINGGNCNVTVRMKSNSQLDMTIRDMDGIILEKGYPTIGVQVNNCAIVQVTVYDGSTVLFSKNVTEEIHADEKKSDVLKIVIPLCVVLVIIISVIVVIVWKRRNRRNGEDTGIQMNSTLEAQPEDRLVNSPQEHV